MLKKIVITGGPSSGKTCLIEHLQSKGFSCMPEISREVIIEAQKLGVEQLFLEDPILFSKKLLKGRLKQYQDQNHKKEDYLFYDRGLPDVTAYMDYTNTLYPNFFSETCNNHRYDMVFLLPPWKEIYKQDNERYETYDEAVKIHTFLLEGYQKYGYTIIEIPHGTLEERKDFILNTLKQKS